MPYANHEDILKYQIEYYQKNRKRKIREAKINYYKNFERRKITKKIWEKNNLVKLREYRRKYYVEIYPYEKKKAIWTVDNAIRAGKIIRDKKCSLCFSKKRIQAHHENYKKPLDIKWLCQVCHKKQHRKE